MIGFLKLSLGPLKILLSDRPIVIWETLGGILGTLRPRLFQAFYHGLHRFLALYPHNLSAHSHKKDATFLGIIVKLKAGRRENWK